MPEMPEGQQRRSYLVGNGHYRLCSPLSRDDLGELWRGEHVPGGEPVTVRVLADDLARDPLFVARLHRELRTEKRARPVPGIARVLDHSRRGQSPLFIVMEAMGRETLADKLARGDRFWFPAARNIISTVGDRLAAAREAGVAHGRIKARSIVLPSAEVRADLSDITLIDLAVEAALFTEAERRSQVRHLSGPLRQSMVADAASKDLDHLLGEMVASPEAGAPEQRRRGRIGVRVVYRQLLRPVHAFHRRRRRGVLIGAMGSALVLITVAAFFLRPVGGEQPYALPNHELGIAGIFAPTEADHNRPSAPGGPAGVGSDRQVPGTKIAPRVQVPLVLGASAFLAWRRITEAGLILGAVVPVEGPPGRVVRTVPAPNEFVSRGAGVTLYVGSASDRFSADQSSSYELAGPGPSRS
jgi:serine/threonine protein kinase